MGKNRPSVHRLAPCLLRPTSSFLPLSSSSARSCSIFQLFFPQWEHFYGNWSPCNDSSWYACSTPDSPMTSRTPSANQQPATSPTNKSPLRSPTVDAAASCHRWRQEVTNETRFSHLPPPLFFFLFRNSVFAHLISILTRFLTTTNKSGQTGNLWRGVTRRQPKGDVLSILPCVLSLLPAFSNGAAGEEQGAAW